MLGRTLNAFGKCPVAWRRRALSASRLEKLPVIAFRVFQEGPPVPNQVEALPGAATVATWPYLVDAVGVVRG